MKTIILFLISFNLFSSQVFFIPDESRHFLFWIKRDFRTAKNIKMISSEFSSKIIFRIVRKYLNHDEVSLKLILDKNRKSLISQLEIYEQIEISTLSGLQNSEMNLNFIIIDNIILYILSNPLTKKGLNQNYGYLIRTKDKKMIQKFNRIFKIIQKRT